MSEFNHDLRSDERQRVGYNSRDDIQDRLRRYALGQAGLTMNRFMAEAIENQVAAWFGEEMQGEDPVTGQAFTKPANSHFPDKPDGLNFRRGGEGGHRGDTSQVTIRTDPELLRRWWAGVWHLPEYELYPGLALDEAIHHRLNLLLNKD